MYDVQCGTSIALSKNPTGTDEISFSITDEENIDDSKQFYIEIRKVSGNLSTNWDLTIEGNVTL